MNPLRLQSIGLIFEVIMFFTSPPWKSKLHEAFCTPDQQCWFSVELALNSPWYLMTVNQTEQVEDKEVTVYRRNIMVSKVSELERLAQQEFQSALKFESAMIVIPKLINGKETWTMEPLVALWEAEEPDAPGVVVEICETKSGAKYVTTFGACSLEELTNQSLRYRFPMT